MLLFHSPLELVAQRARARARGRGAVALSEGHEDHPRTRCMRGYFRESCVVLPFTAGAITRLEALVLGTHALPMQTPLPTKPSPPKSTVPFARSTSMHRPLLLRRNASRSARRATGCCCCCCSATPASRRTGGCSSPTGLPPSRTHRRADALSMARCASAEKMPVVPAISSSVFEGSKALQPLRPSAVAQRRHALGLASLVCGMAVTRE